MVRIFLAFVVQPPPHRAATQGRKRAFGSASRDRSSIASTRITSGTNRLMVCSMPSLSVVLRSARSPHPRLTRRPTTRMPMTTFYWKKIWALSLQGPSATVARARSNEGIAADQVGAFRASKPPGQLPHRSQQPVQVNASAMSGVPEAFQIVGRRAQEPAVGRKPRRGQGTARRQPWTSQPR